MGLEVRHTMNGFESCMQLVTIVNRGPLFNNYSPKAAESTSLNFSRHIPLPPIGVKGCDG